MNRIFQQIALIATLLLPTAVSAQATASVSASAQVLAQLTAAGTADLDFGDVIPGFPRSVAPSDPEAGRFLITGAHALEVSVSFSSLPSSLLHSDGVTELPISFGGGVAGFGASAGSLAGTFDPGTGLTTSLQGTDLHVVIGGTVLPATGQPPGSYSGVITLDVAYTGN